MLASLCDLLKDAEKGKYAIAAFNTPSMEGVRAAVSAAEELSVPVILSHAEAHDKIVPIEMIGKVMMEAAKDSKVPVCVHLDHGSSFELIYKAMDMGFTSVMFDGSNLPYEKNIELTCQVVHDAHLKGVSVEAELGIMTTSGISTETGSTSSTDNYTNPELAHDFVQKTGIDALAASFGTVHGLYLTAPNLDFERLNQIHSKAGIPIVMHGGSGVSKEDYIKAINNGVRKINYYTYAVRAAGEVIRQRLMELKGPAFYHDITLLAIDAMKQDFISAMKVFYNKN